MATYDPFRELNQLMNQAFTNAKSLSMPMDLHREGDRYIATIDLPGVDADSIDIDVDDRTITIRAERRAAQRESADWISRERSYGTYARQITVGTGLALDKIEAEYTDGVLTLTIPVAEEAKPRKITVTRGNAAGKPVEAGTVVPGSVESSSLTSGSAPSNSDFDLGGAITGTDLTAD